MTTLRLLIAALTVGVAVLISFGLAKLGEPQSAWLWGVFP